MSTLGNNPRANPGDADCLAAGNCLATEPREIRLCDQYMMCIIDYKARTGMLPQAPHARDDPERRSVA